MSVTVRALWFVETHLHDALSIDTIADVVQARPNGPRAGDDRATLAYIRDLAVTTAKYAKGDVANAVVGAEAHAETIVGHLRALEAHLATKFG